MHLLTRVHPRTIPCDSPLGSTITRCYPVTLRSMENNMSKLIALIARRETLVAQLAKLDQKIAAAEVESQLSLGQTVSLRYGRGETVGVVTGEVIGFDDKKVAVRVGEGLDAEIIKAFRVAIVVDGVAATDGDTAEDAPASAE